MKHKILVVALLGLFVACTAPKDPTNPLFSGDNMLNFLYDLHIYESMISEMYVPKEQSAIHYNRLFDKHHITPQQFDSALTWYEQNRREYEKLYNQLKERYNQEIQKIESGIYQYYLPPIPCIWTYWGVWPKEETWTLSYAQYTYYLQLPASKLRTNNGRCYPYIERFGSRAPFWEWRDK